MILCQSKKKKKKSDAPSGQVSEPDRRLFQTRKDGCLTKVQQFIDVVKEKQSFK